MPEIANDGASGTAIRWADNHCHLPRGEDEALAAVRAANDSGVELLVDVGCDIASSQLAIDHAAQFPGVFATAGIHPHEARHGVEGLADLATAPEVVAVGECGLDYYYDHSPRETQRQVFAEQIALAHRLAKPLVIHTRDAWDDTFDILDAERVPDRTVFHCFTGGPDEAEAALERGAMLSFSGIVTFKSAGELREAALLCPIDRLMVETDSPYLAPAPHRGKPNQPAFVSLVGERVAELQGMDLAEFAAATLENTKRFYGIDQEVLCH